MIIRTVQRNDLLEIKSIADSLAVTPESRDKDMGFYDYSLTLEQYERRSESSLFLVAFQNSRLEGFCMAYDKEFVRRLTEKEPQLQGDAVFDYLSQLKEDYVYIDQVAVRKPQSFIGSLSACQLMDRIREMSRDRDSIIGVVPHYPWKNSTAIRFHEHQGTALIEQIGSKDKIVFGVYRISLD